MPPSRPPKPQPAKIDLPIFTGQVPYDTEQAILRLREHVESVITENRNLRAQLSGLPRPLTLAEIQAALSSTGSHPVSIAGSPDSVPPQTQPPSAPPRVTVPNHLDIVQAAYATLGGLNDTSTPEQLFRFAQLCAWNIQLANLDPPTIHVGLLMQGGGDGIFTCAGTSYACFRICYDNGANIKILTGSFQPQWTQEADVPLTDYHVPTDPAGAC